MRATCAEPMVFVDQLRLPARVGVNPGEQGAEQPIVLDIWVRQQDCGLAARSEKLRHAVDYVGLTRTARRVVQKRHYPLVETLATCITEALLGRPGVTWARVRLRKVRCLRRAAAAGVAVELSLDDLAPTVRPVPVGGCRDPEGLVVVGGGAAGLSAALWCHRLGHPALVLAPAPRLGGLLHHVHGTMPDLPALRPMSGEQLVRRLEHQFVGHNGRWLRAGLRDLDVDPEGCTLTVESEDDGSSHRLRAHTVVLATGTRRRSLGVPGERRLAGRGVLATAAKGAEAYAGREVVVVGGGDAACENALILAEAGARVIVVHRRARFSCLRVFARRLERHPNIRCRMGQTVLAFEGEQRLERVRVQTDDGPQAVAAEGVLVRVGWVPNSDGLPEAWLDRDGHLQADGDGAVIGARTDRSRVFGAGDMIRPVSASVANAFGSGAVAARSAVTTLETE